MIPYGKQSITEEDIAAVVDVLRSDFLTCGPKVEEFEHAFAEKVGAKHAVACNSATSALHLAMRVLNVGPGDRIVTSPNTFVASANCAAFVGATPDFCDINPVTYNLDLAVLEADWKSDTKAVVAVDYAGLPCNMPEIARIARGRGAYVIEDACHAVGGGFEFEGKMWKAGGHPWADITTFSFHPVKTMTTGEGGILVTDNEEWAAKARLLRSHGITRNPTDFVGLCDPSIISRANPEPQLASSSVESPTVRAAANPLPPLLERGPWYYEMQELGYNYRITDIQCALGISQLCRLDASIRRRQEIVSRYNAAFANLSLLTTPGLRQNSKNSRPSSFILHPSSLSWHLYTVLIDFDTIEKNRTEVMTELRAKGIGSQVLYIPVYLQPWYQKTLGYGRGKCPNAEFFYARCLSLPLFPAMTDEGIECVIAAVMGLVHR